jgi:hypothetical protein
MGVSLSRAQRGALSSVHRNAGLEAQPSGRWGKVGQVEAREADELVELKLASVVDRRDGRRMLLITGLGLESLGVK